jgi:hypothetical protein
VLSDRIADLLARKGLRDLRVRGIDQIVRCCWIAAQQLADELQELVDDWWDSLDVEPGSI